MDSYHIEKAKYLYEMILECEKSGDRTPLTNAHNAVLEAADALEKLDEVTESWEEEVANYSNKSDTEMMEECEFEEDNQPEDILEEIQTSIPTPPVLDDKQPSEPNAPKYNVFGQEIHGDASTLVYMAHINAIFNEMILNKSEKFCKDNYEQYTQFLKATMTYFSDMKVAQLERRKKKDKNWELHFLDRSKILLLQIQI